MYCLWYVKVANADTIQLRQNSFDLEYSDGCFKDKVIISSYKDQSHIPYLKDVICGTGLRTKSKDYEGNVLTIEFLSDSNINSDGFSFHYDSSEKKRDGKVWFVFHSI